MGRTGEVTRKTGETDVVLTRRPRRERARRASPPACPSSTTCSTPSAATGCSIWRCRASGDLAVDAHHTVEDVGICLGQALRRGAGRQARHPALRVGHGADGRGAVSCALDISGRRTSLCEVAVPIEIIGTFDTTLAEEFFARSRTTRG